MPSAGSDPAVPGLFAAATARGVTARGDFSADPQRHGVTGTTYGPLTGAESLRVLRALTRGDDPGRDAPEVPWAAVVRRADGTIAATASTMLLSGIFHARDREPASGRPRLVVGTDPGSVVRTLAVPPEPDLAYLRAFAHGQVSVTGTPYVGVGRVPAGDTVLWRPGASDITVSEWCGPATVPDPDLEGPDTVRLYLETFDRVVDGLAARCGPVVAAMSAGLDSTFMVASLARSPAVSGTITALCHTPLPGADYPERPGWVSDDLPLARLMEQRYPGRVQVVPVTNDALVHPLDAARAASRRSGIPTYGVGNQVWLDDVRRRTAATGASMQWFGSHGNAVFSHTHRYAGSYYLGRGDIRGVRELVRDATAAGQTWPSAVRQRVLAPVRRAGPDRDAFLRWLTTHSLGHAALLNPAAVEGVLVADPFTARSMVELAARITPREWQRGAEPRSFARRAGAGRVPDPIRRRRLRGAQGWDAGLAWRVAPERLSAALEPLAETGTTLSLPLPSVISDARQWQELGFAPTVAGLRCQRMMALAEFSVDAAPIAPGDFGSL